ncbi:hypothetical protein E2A64_07350 [Pseudohoeflea suaedae]|uniref:Uncharacterized protein n=1 Tax=Pseudohoeflea suaedae TaxID=877384 RepID=A0A4R5PQE2_9HYPH|nr:hypothetical protein [Pseudohoeflea suaedae]TDH38901.1 hypothetical protein E2A64_07350 [Pseudohoeflea suaedae]
MRTFTQRLAIGLAAGSLVLALPSLANAQSIGGNNNGGIGVSVGGVSAGIGGNGSGGIGAGASVGGAASASASVGGSDSVADVDANVGGAGGVNADATVDANNGVNADVDVGVGNLNAEADASVGQNTGIAAALGFTSNDNDDTTPPSGIDPDATAAIGKLSDAQLADYKRKCIDVLRSPQRFERDLVDLCKLVRVAASR